uniref:SUEL-type lectin domain-containing protein n=1 Tax=Panagrolaimus sp. JU765 TaxID=591449 RepID=A0AC34QSS3_9BILA
MKVQFWEFNQPNFSDDLNNHDNWLTQCQCSKGWKGQFCDIPSNPRIGTIDNEAIEQIACDDDELIFSCPNGGVILVDYARYGHLKHDNDMKCSKKITKIMEGDDYDYHDNWLTQCQCSKGWKGQFCDIPSNPRIGTIDNEAIEQIACDDDELIFSCPNGGVILVDYARYGHLKHDNDMKCSKKTTKIMEGDDYDCIDPTTLQTLIQKCQGLTFCQISKVVDLFQTNPCSKNYPTSLHYRMRCSTPSNILNQCPYDSIYIQGRCYSANLVNNPNSLMTYDESRMLCNLKGGDLANPQREPIFSMLYSEIDKQGKLYGKLIDEEKFWIRNDSNNLPSMENFKDLCPYLMVTTNVPKPSSCQMRFNWMCEYPPRSDLTDRITEFIGMTTTRGILTTTMRSQTLTEM